MHHGIDLRRQPVAQREREVQRQCLHRLGRLELAAARALDGEDAVIAARELAHERPAGEPGRAGDEHPHAARSPATEA